MSMSEKIVKIILLLLALLALAIFVLPFTAEAQTHIYRSVGSLAAINTGSGSNTLTISGSTATFSANVAERTGVGVLIEFDSTGANTTRNAGVVIVARLTERTFTVKRPYGQTPPAVTGATLWSSFYTFSSLSNWESGTENTNIAAAIRDFDAGNRDIDSNNEIWNVACYSTGATVNEGIVDASSDANALTISGWTTSTTDTLRIYTPYLTTEVGSSQRHSGYFSKLFYNISISSANQLVSVLTPAEHVTFVGIQFEHTGTASSARNCIDFTDLTSSARINIVNCIFKGANSTSADTTSGIDVKNAGTTGTYRIWNNFFFDFDGDQTFRNGITFRPTTGGTAYIYNNTFYRCRNGIERKTAGTVVAKNNLYQSNSLASADGFKGTFDAASDYNLSDLASDAPGANSKNSTTVSFLYPTDTYRDLHLLSTDTGAKDAGVSLASDFSTDGERDARPVTLWDIGADEYVNPATKVKKIYRSVQNQTAALKTGSGNNLTIVDSTATFSSALPDTIVVGDAVQYDSDNNGSIDAICFITLRNSSTSYKVKNRVGLNPTPTSAADQDWSIFRAYTTMAGLATGENNGINAAVRDFDIGKRNLGANNEQVNIALCQRSSTDNSLNAIYWPTTPDCFVRIFAPSCTQETGTTYRHAGKLTATRAGFSGTTASIFTIQPDNASLGRAEQNRFFRIEGLQFNYTSATSSGIIISLSRQSGTAQMGMDIRVENCIFKAVNATSGTGAHTAISPDFQVAGSTTKVLIANNIIYGFRHSGGTPFFEGAICTGTTGTGGLYYIYNNTMFDCQFGIDRNVGTVIAKNNIYQGHQSSQNGYDGTFDAASDYNLSNLTSDAPGANSKNLTAVAFVDSTGEDYHIQAGDTGAQNAGTSLAADANYPISNDVDYADRTGTWDIGADDPSATASTCATLYPAATTSNNRRRAIIQ